MVSVLRQDGVCLSLSAYCIVSLSHVYCMVSLRQDGVCLSVFVLYCVSLYVRIVLCLSLCAYSIVSLSMCV